jgi:hypothetical protein
MPMNEFSEGNFKPRTDEQQHLLERFLRLRNERGEPSRFRILRRLARTRHFTKSIYPPDWRFA